MDVVCLDLEGVLVPEIWIQFAEDTGIEALKATTRDVPDYDELMQQRLSLLKDNNLTLTDIQSVIGQMLPLPGSKAFLDDLRASYQVIILSDTFYEFAEPLMRQLDWPTLFCHKLVISDNCIVDFELRQADPKRHSVRALKQLNFRVFAAGDSYNDTTMLDEADAGFLFRAPENVIQEFPQFFRCLGVLDFLKGPDDGQGKQVSGLPGFGAFLVLFFGTAPQKPVHQPGFDSQQLQQRAGNFGAFGFPQGLDDGFQEQRVRLPVFAKQLDQL